MLRRLKRLPAWFIGAMLIGPVSVLIPAGFLDGGPEGRLRVSFFSIAVTLLDPFVWTCLWNSLVVAVLTTSLSGAGGVWIGRIIVRQGLANNSLMLALAAAALAIPPTYSALGLIQLFQGAVQSSPLGLNADWFVLVLAEACNGLPIVTLITLTALRGIDPRLEDSARLAGATPRKIWRKIVWPVARPELTRGLSLIFALTLLEPGAPSLLGLRRTIGFQVIQTARDSALIGRAASLTVVALGVATLGRLLIEWWGGTRAARPSAGDLRGGARAVHRSWSEFLRLLPVFVISFLVAGLPLIGLTRGFEQASIQVTTGELSPWAAILEEPWIRNSLFNAIQLGILVVLIELAAVKLLTIGVSETRGRERLLRLARLAETIPPVVFGMGVLVVPEVSRILLKIPAESAGGIPSTRPLIGGLLGLLEPRSGSWLPLVLSVAAVRFSLVARARVEDSLELRPACIDLARLAGRSASRRPSGGWGGVSIASLLLTFSLAANSVAPALLLAPTAETRPIGPTILKLSDTPRPGRGIASALALVGIALNLAAILAVSRELKTRPREPL